MITMTDERIKEEFEKWVTGYYTEQEAAFANTFDSDFSDLVAGFYAGFRAAERLAKTEVLNELDLFVRMITDQEIAGKQRSAYYLACKHFKHEIENQLTELKELTE